MLRTEFFKLLTVPYPKQAPDLIVARLLQAQAQWSLFRFSRGVSVGPQIFYHHDVS